MFTKSNNAYNFPLPSPRNTSAAAAATAALNANELLLLHHHEMLAAANHEFTSLAAGAAAPPPPAAKKDRHSKIDTAQGPRDRRVRLSIGVARKFFDLQENLGFDKPSKTLDWLLTNSKAAIKDLEEARAAASAGGGGGDSEVDSGEKSASNSGKATATSLARESRAKARARARERTREKMCIKQKLNETRSFHHNNGDFNHIQFMNNQLKFASSSNVNLGFHSYEGGASAANQEDLIQESIVIKRKVKNPMGFQQNLFISSSNYGLPPPYSAATAAAENWDSICAILDQHKFINSASNN